MKILVATDKFKGSLSSQEAGFAISKGVQSAWKDADIVLLPMADGGDGFSKVLKHYSNTNTITAPTIDPLFRNIEGHYEWDEPTRTAIIEMAVASGLVLLKKEERNPLLTSTYGTGLLIKHAIEQGAETIILGLGGSATNDGGMGLAAALGFDFFDKQGRSLSPIGASLIQLHHIAVPSNLPSVKFVIACDVNNPLFGERGAAHVYARQKGADDAMVIQLDEGLQNLALCIEQSSGIQIHQIPGSGAAGGIASFLLAFFNCELKSGIDLVVEQSSFFAHLAQAEWLVTGEGSIDHQSLQGKLVGCLMQHARQAGKKILLVCGQASDDIRSKLGDTPLISLMEFTNNEALAMKNASALLSQEVSRFFNSI